MNAQETAWKMLGHDGFPDFQDFDVVEGAVADSIGTIIESAAEEEDL